MIPVLLPWPVQVDDIGMLVIKYGNPWSFGGPTVMHSPWWVRAHWGRAFEIERLDPGALQGFRIGGHDLAWLRKPSTPPPTVPKLEAVDPGEERELIAVETALKLTRSELCPLRDELFQVRGECEQAREEAGQQTLLAEDRALQLASIRTSQSWRLTRPLRAINSRLKSTHRSTLD